MRSHIGGRHELGQNFLRHKPTINTIIEIVSQTDGHILELCAGDGALTTELAKLGRRLFAIEIDGHRVHRLRRRLPHIDARQADVLRVPLDQPVVVGNLPFHLTTPIMRKLLGSRQWNHAIVLTQWEVARKRAGVGGRTMMTAQAAPWFEFHLHGRVPADGFFPKPSVDGGILCISRRDRPLISHVDRRKYQEFVHTVFTGRGRGLAQILSLAFPHRGASWRRILRAADIMPSALPRNLTPEQWQRLWAEHLWLKGQRADD